MSGSSCAGFIVLAFLLTPLVLLGMGFFGTTWVPNETCDTIGSKVYCCSAHTRHRRENGTITNYTSTPCSSPFSLSDLDTAAAGCQSIAFFIMLLPFICGALEIWANWKSDEVGCCGLLSGLAFLLYPLAGLLSFVGSMIISAKFSGSKFGESFNYCLGSGLYVLGFTGLSIAIICCLKRRNRGDSGGSTEVEAVDTNASSFVVFIRRVDVMYYAQHISVSE